MKNLKKILASLTAVFMMLLCVGSVTASAESTYTLTITDDKSDEEYVAYPIFTGVISTDVSTLSDIQWADGFNHASFVTDLKTVLVAGAELAAKFNNITTESSAEEVAKVLSSLTDSTGLITVANIAGKYVGTAAGTSTRSDDEKSYVISGLAPGYYLVKNTKFNAETTASRFLLNLVGNTTATPKRTTVPPVGKSIIDATNARVKAINAEIGKTITFELTSQIPDMTGFVTYNMSFEDTLSDGLTFGSITSVKIGNSDYNSYTSTLTGNKLTVDLGDVITQTQGANIVVTYTATVNAVVSYTTGENNTVVVKYPQNPATNEFGTTTEEKVYVYSFFVDVFKYDGSTENTTKTALDGAEFVLKKGDTYYKYTAAQEADPDAGKEAVAASVSWVNSQEEATVLTSDESGKISNTGLNIDGFVGLEPGTYSLVEIKAPDGFNTCDPTSVTISQPTLDSNGVIDQTGANQKLSVTYDVANYSGQTLPSTGGMGTTILYVAGGILVLGAAIFFITNKRMQRN